MTPKQKARRREYYRKRRATMTPEQLDVERAYQRGYARRRVATMTPEQLDAEKARRREYNRKRRASMTHEQRNARRESDRKRRATMTPEQRDARREYEREYARKRRAKAATIMQESLESPERSSGHGEILGSRPCANSSPSAAIDDPAVHGMHFPTPHKPLLGKDSVCSHDRLCKSRLPAEEGRCGASDDIF
jgi:hypothetical protein